MKQVASKLFQTDKNLLQRGTIIIEDSEDSQTAYKVFAVFVDVLSS